MSDSHLEITGERLSRGGEERSILSVNTCSWLSTIVPVPDHEIPRSGTVKEVQTYPVARLLDRSAG